MLFTSQCDYITGACRHSSSTLYAQYDCININNINTDFILAQPSLMTTPATDMGLSGRA